MLDRRSILFSAILFLPTVSRAQQVQVTGAGATFPAPLYHRWAADAESAIGTRVNYQSIGSGGGINQVRARTVTFGATDAPLSDPGDLFQFPTVEGEVVAAFNLPGIASLNLTMELVNSIYAGRITRWNDLAIQALNPTVRLPNVPLSPVYRADGSGTTFIWTTAMRAAGNWDSVGTSIAWPTGQGARGNEGVTNIVRRSPGSIGYIEKTYAVVNRVPYATLDVQVRGKTYILLPREPRDRAAHSKAVEFFDYCLTRGLETARRMHYEPLSDAEYGAILQELKSI